MAELKFRRIEISDGKTAREYLAKSNFRGCEYTFGNNFVWRNVYNNEICFAEGFYFIKNGIGGKTRFIYPVGNGDMKTAVGLLEEYCAENNIPLIMYANKETAQRLTETYHAKAVFNRDISDYVYLAEDLENLAGKKYHGKRNHLNRFYENDWSFEPLTADNIGECRAMNDRWRSENICEMSDAAESKREELCIVECSFKHYDELGYTGGVLRVNGEVQAFTFGERSSEDCFVVHVEKALREFQGAYTAVNREFVKSLGGKYKYINREEDTGSEGLRKAKLSYHPVFLEEKFVITF
ncbi:MAG: DUF2156 domain-containing protein [Ruminococcaceae bacterium]|nr:DUF2156 domain-containing protein [Oscillospiraceae bacterium]